MQIADFGLINGYHPYFFPICNLYPVEFSGGGPPLAAFHRAGQKSAIGANPLLQGTRCICFQRSNEISDTGNMMLL